MKMTAMTMKARMMRIGGLVLEGHEGTTKPIPSRRRCLSVSHLHLRGPNASFSLHSTFHHHRHSRTTARCNCAIPLLPPLHPLTCFPSLTLLSRAHQTQVIAKARALRHMVKGWCLSHLLPSRGKTQTPALTPAVLSPQ